MTFPARLFVPSGYLFSVGGIRHCAESRRDCCSGGYSQTLPPEEDHLAQAIQRVAEDEAVDIVMLGSRALSDPRQRLARGRQSDRCTWVTVK